MAQNKQEIKVHAASMKWALNQSLTLTNVFRSLVIHIVSALNLN